MVLLKPIPVDTTTEGIFSVAVSASLLCKTTLNGTIFSFLFNEIKSKSSSLINFLPNLMSSSVGILPTIPLFTTLLK